MTTQTAIKTLDEFYVKTCAYMDQRDIPFDQYQQVRGYLLHKACMEECQPLIDMLTQVHLQMIPTRAYVMGPNGLESFNTELQGESKRAADTLQEQIRGIQAKYLALAEQ